MGSRLLGREKDMITALAVTNTCAWAYDSSNAGVGPESFTFLPEGSPIEESDEPDKESTFF